MDTYGLKNKHLTNQIPKLNIWPKYCPKVFYSVFLLICDVSLANKKRTIKNEHQILLCDL